MAWVRGTLEQVREICRELPGGVEDLPRPSLEAFRFLEEVARQGLPPAPPGGEALPSRPKIQAPGLVSFLDAMLLDLGRPGGSRLPAGEHREKAAEQAERVRDWLGGRGLDPSFLPRRTGLAFAWLEWLGREDHMGIYLEGVRRFLPGLSELAPPGKGGGRIPASVLFLPGRYLYRRKVEKGFLVWRLHCGFLQAEPREAVLSLRIFSKGKERGSTELHREFKEFVSSPRFFSLSREIEAVLAGKGRDLPKGRAWDLEVLFEKINREYFSGRLVQPRLSWGDRPARNKLGSYDLQKNRITLSPILDDPALPECAVAYVLYHEMLHLERPGKVVGGRLMSHDTWFRRREERFKEREEAEKVLRRIWGGEGAAGG